MKTEQPREWTPGQLTQGIAQFVVALGMVLVGFDPSKLLPLLLMHGAKLIEKLQEAIAAFVQELTLTLLPLFAEQLRGWQVIEERGTPLPDDWDPRPFLDGLMIGCVHPDGAEYMKGEDLVTEARKRLKGRGGLSQYEADWFYRHWQDERIPDCFRQAVESGEIYLIVTETILLNPSGVRCVLYLHWRDGQLHWDYYWLGHGYWYRCYQVLVPGDSSS